MTVGKRLGTMATSKTKLRVAVLALVLSGASVPVILDQFLNDK